MEIPVHCHGATATSQCPNKGKTWRARRHRAKIFFHSMPQQLRSNHEQGSDEQKAEGRGQARAERRLTGGGDRKGAMEQSEREPEPITMAPIGLDT